MGDWFLFPHKNEAPLGASMGGESATSPNSNAFDLDDIFGQSVGKIILNSFFSKHAVLTKFEIN